MNHGALLPGAHMQTIHLGI